MRPEAGSQQDGSAGSPDGSWQHASKVAALPERGEKQEALPHEMMGPIFLGRSWRFHSGGTKDNIFLSENSQLPSSTAAAALLTITAEAKTQAR